MVARVGTTYLYRSELAVVMPRGIDKQDSVSYSQAFISKWIVGQLKQQEAEKLFSQSQSDIDRMVEEYRRSLLVHRLDKHFLEADHALDNSPNKKPVNDANTIRGTYENIVL